MPTDHTHRPWAIRSTLAVVADLDRSVDFYRELGPFDEIVREGAVAVLGEGSPASIVLILREGRSNYARRSQQSLGLRSITFNVGSSSELDRTESVLRGRKLFTSRRQLTSGGSDLLYGRDPDNMPLVFVYYVGDEALGSDYYRTVADLAYSLDV